MGRAGNPWEESQDPWEASQDWHAQGSERQYPYPQTTPPEWQSDTPPGQEPALGGYEYGQLPRSPQQPDEQPQNPWEPTQPYEPPPQQDNWQLTRAYDQPLYPPHQPCEQPPSELTAQRQVNYRPSPAHSGRRRNSRKLNGILLGITAAAALLLIIVLAVGGGKSRSTGNTAPTAATMASSVAKTPPTAKKTPPKNAPTAVASSQAAAPSTPAPTTHAAAPATSRAPVPPASAAPVSCHPLTNGGKCYEAGETCRNVNHGMTGVAGDGEAISCQNNDGWHWEQA
jgi:hypothetical protein